VASSDEIPNHGSKNSHISHDIDLTNSGGNNKISVMVTVAVHQHHQNNGEPHPPRCSKEYTADIRPCASSGSRDSLLGRYPVVINWG
jgi:hypothetical protein